MKYELTYIVQEPSYVGYDIELGTSPRTYTEILSAYGWKDALKAARRYLKHEVYDIWKKCDVEVISLVKVVEES